MCKNETNTHSKVSLSKSTVLTFMAAAYVTTAAVYAVALFANADLRQPSIWIPLSILFAIFTLMVYLDVGGRGPVWRRFGFLLFQVGLVFAIVLVGRGFGYLPILYFVVLPMAYFSLSFWQANAIALVSVFSLLVALALAVDVGIGTAAVLVLPYAGGMVFFAALTVTLIRQSEERQRAERLLAELEDAHSRLRGYAAQVKELAVAEERNRLAREIHDTLGHYLTAITMQLEAAGKLIVERPEQAAKSIAKAEEMVRESLADVRRSVAALRTSPLDTVVLSEAIGELVENLHSSGVVTTFTVEGETQSIPLRIKTGLYRVAQEGLTNVRKHANASAVDVKLSYGSEQVTLAIEDNGTGQRGETIGGFGLMGLRERLTLLGGTLQAENCPPGGFRLYAAIPRQVQRDE